MAEHGTPDQNSSRAPFIHALVQKSVTAITNLAGRLSTRMLRERCMNSQEGAKENLLPRFDVERWMDRPNPLNGRIVEQTTERKGTTL